MNYLEVLKSKQLGKRVEFKSIFTNVRRGGSSNRDVKNGLAYAINKGSGKNDLVAVFYIGINLMKKAKFIAGDRMDIQKSADGKYGLIKRINKGGYALSMKHTKNTGKISTSFIDELPRVNSLTVLENVVVDDEGILFEWPTVPPTEE